jgi:hypothetical protein
MILYNIITENKVSWIYMIVYLLILFFSLLIAYQLIFEPIQEGLKGGRGGLPGGRRIKKAIASKKDGMTVRGGGGGGSNMDRVLKNHDEIVNLKAVMNTQYKPLIKNSEGKPTNILTRLASLEGDVKALTQAAMDKQENAVDNIPQAPDFKK